MEAKEFRLGNIINFRGVPMPIVSITPTPMNEWGVNLCSDDVVAKFMNSHDGIGYEPLTEDWLLKFGFEPYGNEVGFERNNKEPSKKIYAKIHLSGISIFNYSECNKKQMQFITIIECVHQLQNLYFALTGKELEAKE